MKATWKDKDYRYWQYPHPLPYDMIKLWRFCERLRKEHPHVWRQGGNLLGNSAYRVLSRVVKQGHFTGKETIRTEAGRKLFIPAWQSWMARHQHDHRLPGLVAHLKWLSIPKRGWDYTYGQLYQAMNNPALQKSKPLLTPKPKLNKLSSKKPIPKNR